MSGNNIPLFLGVIVGIMIAITILVWMYNDTKKRGVNPWPWILSALLLGVGVVWIIYLVVRGRLRPASTENGARFTKEASDDSWHGATW